MQIFTQLPVGILCILFAHCARVTAVCPTLPCSEDVPVYGTAPPVEPEGPSTTPVSRTQARKTPLSSTIPVVIAPTTKSNPPPAPILSTSSTSTPVPPTTTASSTTPISTPSSIPPAATPTSTPTAEPTATYIASSSTGIPTSTPLSTTATSEVPTVTFPSTTAVSSKALSSVNQSTTAFPFGTAASNSSVSATVPASITQCGGCRVLADQVQVYYWPTASVKNDCARGVSVSPFETGVPYAANASKIQSLAPQVVSGLTTNVVDGHTL